MSLINRAFISSVLTKTADEVLAGARSNCFNAVRNAFSENLDLKVDGPMDTSPKPADKFEIVTFDQALEHYINFPWIRVTRHRCKCRQN